jgi:GT2 family glycosyltransferase
MKLSIIIPTIGRKTLQRVLSALVRSNDFESIAPEIIVVRDAVEGAFLSQLETEFPQVTFLTTKEKSYSGGARNVGLDKATGEVIIFLGDDTIPKPNWLKGVLNFHQSHPQKEAALLGKISWVPELVCDPFHQWLENNAQFAFSSIRKKGADWRHFYTSNISLKKELIGTERFSDQFTGWGFEDTEFGYRLSQKGMKISFEPECEVLHDHEQSLEQVLNQSQNARNNAVIFETLHPEISILPRGGKKILLQCLILFSHLIPTQKMKWWREWKKAWLGL